MIAKVGKARFLQDAIRGDDQRSRAPGSSPISELEEGGGGGVVGSHRCLSQVLKCCCPFNLSQIKFVNERRNAAGQATEKSLTWFS